MTAPSYGVKGRRVSRIADALRPLVDAPYIPLVALVLVALMQLQLVFDRAINWDEFHFYRQVELFAKGTLEYPLQTLHVRVFQWLPGLDGTGVDHIVIARIFMFACEIATTCGIVLLATRFTNFKTGFICALAYLSSGFVMQHGFSFRTDPIITALTMGALCILGCTRFKGVWLILFGALIAAAAMFSIKIVLWAPAFAGLAWWRWNEEGRGVSLLLRVMLATLFTALFFALIYLYHSAGVTVDDSAGTVLQNSAGKMFFFGIPIYWALMLKFVSMSEVLVLTILCFPVALYASRLTKHAKVAMVGLFLPLSALFFYFNTLPYFYAFMLPPVVVACSVPLSMLRDRYGAALPAIAFFAMAFGLWIKEDQGVIDRQRELQATAHTIFPEGVSYFDFSGFLPDQDKSNAFMTLWGTEIYLKGGAPSMRSVMEQKSVPLVIELDDMFTAMFQPDDPASYFLPQDAAALRYTYQPFWGPFWVAGKIVASDAQKMNVEFLVPGPYTLSGGAIEFDGRKAYPGDVIAIDRGMHRLSALEGKEAHLTWGDHLKKPEQAPPPRPYWTYF